MDGGGIILGSAIGFYCLCPHFPENLLLRPYFPRRSDPEVVCPTERFHNRWYVGLIKAEAKNKVCIAFEMGNGFASDHDVTLSVTDRRELEIRF